MGTIDLDEIQAKLRKNEARTKRRMIIFTIIPVLITFVLVYYSTNSINTAQKQLQQIKSETDSIKKLRDSYRLQYLEAKGLTEGKQNDRYILKQSINADDLLKDLLLVGKIDSNLRIQYFKKKLDQDKSLISLKDLGYLYFDELSNAPLKNVETNCVSFGSNVSSYDIKIICLSLIRAGFKIRLIKPFKRDIGRENMVQIAAAATLINNVYVSINNKPISADKIYRAKDINALIAN